MVAATRGPTPRTRSTAAISPNGPSESRLATMRRASAGPMRGSRSISAAPATSRSTGEGRGTRSAARGAPAAPALSPDGRPAPSPAPRRSRLVRLPDAVTLFLPRARSAESTRWMCRASACRDAAVGGAPSPLPRTACVPAPSTATAERKRSARRSEEVIRRGTRDAVSGTGRAATAAKIASRPGRRAHRSLRRGAIRLVPEAQRGARDASPSCLPPRASSLALLLHQRRRHVPHHL